MNKYLFPLLGLLLLPATTGAQELVRFPLGDASWSVQLVHKEKKENTSAEKDPANQPLRCAQIVARRVSDYRRDAVTWTDGSQTETWWTSSPAMVFFEDPRINELVVASGNDIYGSMLYDESLFKWITAANKVGEERLNGKSCIVYQGMALANGEVNSGVPTRVWVDKETLLPVATDDGQTLANFNFDVPPAALPALPAKIAKLLERQRTATAAALPQKKERIRR